MGCVPRKAFSNTNLNQNPEKKAESTLKITSALFVRETIGDPYSDYELLDRLGEGSYGKVYRARNNKTGAFRAIKEISKSSILSKDNEKKLVKEISILKDLDHPNILKVYEFYSTKSDLFIISELCTGGELFKKIVEVKYFPEKVTAHIMKQLFSAVRFCHLNNIIHRDLKPENILIESTEERSREFFTIKIIDFGTSEYKKNKMLKEKIGSSYYIAPEVLNNGYNEKCDLWSCGVILYILLCGYPPFNGKTDDDILNKVEKGVFSMEGSIWNGITDEAKDLIRNLLTRDINKRFSAEQALEHPWFNKIGLCSKKIPDNKLKTIINNLKSFHAEQQLQHVVLTMIVHNLAQRDDVLELRKVFLSFDENGDGRIAKDELAKGLGQIMPSSQAKNEVDKIMSHVDVDNSGFIEYEEFLRASLNKQKILTLENLQYAFNLFDKDSSGKISLNELSHILGNDKEKKNDKIFKEMISNIDINGDGEISFEEFKTMMYGLIEKGVGNNSNVSNILDA
jgi:calcium-dependent protein kinase